MVSLRKFSSADVGCYVAGHHGWHGHAMMLDFAHDAGWPVSQEDYTTICRYDTGDPAIMGENDPEIVVSLMDDAETWLNENVAAEGYSFGWYEGEFFFSPNHGDETAWCQTEGAECDEGCGEEGA